MLPFGRGLELHGVVATQTEVERQLAPHHDLVEKGLERGRRRVGARRTDDLRRGDHPEVQPPREPARTAFVGWLTPALVVRIEAIAHELLEPRARRPQPTAHACHGANRMIDLASRDLARDVEALEIEPLDV